MVAMARTGWLMLGALAGVSARAAPVRVEAPATLYIRAQAAGVDGDVAAASASYAALLERDPGNVTIAEHAYRQSVVAGDFPLALRAARMLDRLGRLPPDGRLLLALDAIRTRAWPQARAAADQIEKDRLFAFLVPALRAWIAVGSRTGDPLAALDAARAIPLAQPYVAEQRALVMLALGRTEEGVAALRGPQPSSLDRLSPHLRLILADALAASRQRERAVALLAGDEPYLMAARARIAAGKRLPERVEEPLQGLAALMVNVAADLGRQRLDPIALTFGRLATFAAPGDASGWIFVAQIIAQSRNKAVALAALDHVAPDDPLVPIARTLRIAVLTQTGDKQAALADALKAAERDGAGAVAWARVGDVYSSLDRPRDAAAAYRKAVDLTVAANAPADQQWPPLLQLAEALDEAGDWPGAHAALERALALAPGQPLVLNQLGYSEIAHRENVARGSGLIEQASRLRPDDSAITDSLGWSYYLRGDTAKALPLLEKAVTGAPAEPTINEHLGDVYWTRGRLYEARYAWRAALVTAEDKNKPRLSAKIDTGLSAATASP